MHAGGGETGPFPAAARSPAPAAATRPPRGHDARRRQRDLELRGGQLELEALVGGLVDDPRAGQEVERAGWSSITSSSKPIVSRGSGASNAARRSSAVGGVGAVVIRVGEVAKVCSGCASEPVPDP